MGGALFVEGALRVGGAALTVEGALTMGGDRGRCTESGWSIRQWVES